MDQDTLMGKYFDEITKYMQNNGEVEQRSEEFKKLTNDYDRICYVITQPFVQKIVVVPRYDGSEEQKSSSLALQYRQEGNKKFQSKDYTGALELYNKCIRVAPKPVQLQDKSSSGSDLTLAYANRSAALFHLNNFHHSLSDVKRAFANSYPQNLQYKLYDRQARCLTQLKQYEAAITAFKNAKNALPLSDVDSNKRTYWEKQFTKGLILCKEQRKSDIEGDCESLLPATICDPPPVYQSKHNNTFTSLSETCDVSFTEQQGRYITAKENLTPGDVVLVEKPFASVLLPEHYTDHCHHCLTNLVTFIACDRCSVVSFCGENCKESAVNSYHRYECSVLLAVHASGVGKFGHLSLRSVTCRSLQYFRDFRDKINKQATPQDFRLRGTAPDHQYNSQDYHTIYNLVGHSDRRNPNDLYMRTISAVFLLKCLQGTTYFDDQSSSNDLDLQHFIGSLILSHLQSFPCNAHEISELVLDKMEVATSVCQEIGAGIYATLSLFNHSCNPAATRHFYGNSCVVRALRPITAGEEISDNYGAVFAVQDKTERQSRLKPQYYFECNCVACTDNWPLYPDIASENPAYLCTNCKAELSLSVDSNPLFVRCDQCNEETNLESVTKQFNEATEKYYKGLGNLLEYNITSAKNELTEAMVGIYGNVKKPWRDINNTEEALKQCFNTLGNCVVIKEKQ